jgi:hypothetical protein
VNLEESGSGEVFGWIDFSGGSAGYKTLWVERNAVLEKLVVGCGDFNFPEAVGLG